jgi:hypothetical protein
MGSAAGPCAQAGSGWVGSVTAGSAIGAGTADNGSVGEAAGSADAGTTGSPTGADFSGTLPGGDGRATPASAAVSAADNSAMV